MFRLTPVILLLVPCVLVGCQGKGGIGRGPYGQQGPAYDRPYPLGVVTDDFWETQQTNAEAADFIFFDHEFEGNTAKLTPGAKKKLMSVALRMDHVPFPITIEESQHNARPHLDLLRRRTVIEQLGKLGVEDIEKRVVIAPAFAEGIAAIEGEQAYYSTLGGGGGGFGGGGTR
jgi:hypothetical protein